METKQNKVLTGVIALSATALLVALFTGGRDITVQPNANEHTVAVRGESEQLVAPDTARMSFSMTRKSKDLSAATESVNQRIAEMVDVLSEYGVEDKDMKTTSYNVQPEYNYVRDSGERVFDGYRVRQTIELTIRNLDDVSPILTKVSSFEVDNVSSLSFFVDEDEEIKDELRAEAIANAKEKAKTLSKDLGVELDTIISFHEGNSGGQPPYPVYEERMYGMGGATDSAQAVVPTGENKYTSQVTITYLIEN